MRTRSQARLKRAIASSKLIAFSREVGLTLTPGQAEVAAEFEASGAQTMVLQAGRRGGKSTIEDLLAVFDACVRDHLRQYMRPGEVRVAAIICPRLEQAAEHIRNCRSLIDQSRRLRSMVVSQTESEIRLNNDAAIRAYPCSARGIRGAAWSSALLDEFGHFVDVESGNAAGDRILEAAVPALAQFGAEGWLSAVSTPLWRAGAYYKLVQQATSGRHTSMYYRHLTTEQMNPRIDKAWLKEQKRRDPDLFAREYEAKFVDGASSYLSAADVTACVRAGNDKLYPQPSIAYQAALDPAFSLDRFALAIGHEDELGRVIIDGVWTWHKRGYVATLEDVAQLCRAYHVNRVRTDQFCAVPIREGLEQRRLQVDYVAWDNANKSAAFAALKVGCNVRSVELPDDPALVEELCSLSATPTPSGLVRIAAISGAHDDRAVAVAAVIASFGEGQAITAPTLASAGPSHWWDSLAGVMRSSVAPPTRTPIVVDPETGATRLTPAGVEVIAGPELHMRPLEGVEPPPGSNYPMLARVQYGSPLRRTSSDGSEPCGECGRPPGRGHDPDCSELTSRFGIGPSDWESLLTRN